MPSLLSNFSGVEETTFVTGMEAKTSVPAGLVTLIRTVTVSEPAVRLLAITMGLTSIVGFAVDGAARLGSIAKEFIWKGGKAVAFAVKKKIAKKTRVTKIFFNIIR